MTSPASLHLVVFTPGLGDAFGLELLDMAIHAHEHTPGGEQPMVNSGRIDFVNPAAFGLALA